MEINPRYTEKIESMSKISLFHCRKNVEKIFVYGNIVWV